MEFDRERLEGYGRDPWAAVAAEIRAKSGYDGKRIIDILDDRRNVILRHAVSIDALQFFGWTAEDSPFSPPAEPAAHPVPGDRAIPALGIPECIGRTAARAAAAAIVVPTPAPRVLDVVHREADNDDIRLVGDFGDLDGPEDEDEPDFDFLPTGDDDQHDDIAF